MNVSELIRLLSEFPDTMDVYVHASGNRTHERVETVQLESYLYDGPAIVEVRS